MTGEQGWFVDLDRADIDSAIDRIRTASASTPDDWPQRAIDLDIVDSMTAYYEWLHRATVSAADAAVSELERADDTQLIHAIRTMDDVERITNELDERLQLWAADAGLGMMDQTESPNRRLPELSPSTGSEERIRSLARTLTSLEAEADELRSYVNSNCPTVAPNLAAMAGPVLGARLIALAGGLGSLARLPSGTIQVLGAEDALFAHLRGRASSPKHGVIYGHEYVRSTPAEHRGSAARAVAGKLAIAARVDHYSGDRRPELDQELAERIERIRARGEA